MENNGGLRSRMARLFCPINVEPLLFLYFISLGIMITVVPEFIYFKKCTEIFEERPDTKQFCVNLKSGNSTLQNMVQEPASLFNVYQMVAYNGPSILVSLYLGAWSETNGRKPALLLAIAGVIVSIAFSIPVGKDSVPLWLLLPATLINGFTGGGIVVIMAGFSMITDLSRSPTAITVRISVASACMTFGMVTGNVIVAQILAHVQKPRAYVFAFLAQEVFALLAFLYGVFVVKETVHMDNSETPDNHAGVFINGYKKFRDSFKVVMRPRSMRKRAYLNIGLVLFLVVFATDFGMPGLLLLLVEHSPLNWNDQRYAYMIAITMLASSFGFLLLTPLFKLVKFRDSGITIFGLAFLVGRQILISLSNRSWMVYIYASVSFFSSVLYPGFRAFLSKQVEQDEIGRVFAAIGIVENIAPLMSGFLFNGIYARTVSFFPGFSFAFAALLDFICVIILGWIHIDSYYKSRNTSGDQAQIISSPEEEAEDQRQEEEEQPVTT